MAEALTEDEIDAYMLAASQQYEAEVMAKELATCSQTQDPPQDCSVHEDDDRFGPIVGQDDLTKMVEDSVAKKTRQQTKWCVANWEEWHSFRLAKAKDDAEKPPKLEVMDYRQLDYWISCFIVEVRRKDGSNYIGETLYNMVCGLQRHLWSIRPDFTVDFLSGVEFRGLRGVLDAKMKDLKQKGIGIQKKQAEPITYEEENLLWERGLLGDSSPQILLDSMVWLCGLCFALRSGAEHRSLNLDHLECCDDVIIYREPYSRNHQGGLHQQHDQPKVVYHYANTRNPSRCFVRLFKKYVSLRPPDVSSFYLTPLRKPRVDCWYSRNPVGHNTLTKTVSRLCKVVGIPGFKTNHSLRAMAATRLYHSETDEQLIKSVTGHKSADGVRSYKRTSEDQFRRVSDILQKRGECSKKDGVASVEKLSYLKENSNFMANSSTSSPSINLSKCQSVVINFSKE